MRVLVIGGSGDVGSLVLPVLAEQHSLRVLDLQPPVLKDCEFIQGDLTDPEAVGQAVKGMDALLFMAMGNKNFDSIPGILTAFDISLKGLYLALYLAHEAGISHAVYTSTLSIYQDFGSQYLPDESVTPDSRHVYGFTKRIGEEICQIAVQDWGMSVNALRLCLPVSDEEWQEIVRSGKLSCHTSGSDLARAMLAALDYRDGFQAFMVTGDYTGKMLDQSKAKDVLHWEPRSRPMGER
ncbi:MAG: NAD(P)-dependent oxidoreductase [Anaerolineae bacterium]|nr:NAD(P)-dependent oxidoreductase [Anaerolineae bacterium]